MLMVVPIPANVPVSPQRIVLGIDKGKRASQVSLKNPWKPPKDSPEKPAATFADRLASVVKENKRKSSLQDLRERKKAKTFRTVTTAANSANLLQSNKSEEGNTTEGKGDVEEWCKYTGFNLRSRSLPQHILKEEFKGKTTYSITDLYRLVVPPLYDPPEYDTLDFLVTGIVSSKSAVRQMKNRGEGEGGNYIVVKITDLKVRSPNSFPSTCASFG